MANGNPFPESMQAALAPRAKGMPFRPSPRPEPPALAPVLPRRRSTAALLPIPHSEQFATRYSTGRGVYWSRGDEALRDNWTNALALRQAAFVHDLLRHRQLPVVSLPWRITGDDPKDPDQVRACELLTKQTQAIPRFQEMRLYLSEDKWQGKYGAQLAWDVVTIDGQPRVTIVDHEPIDGDSIVFKLDKTPGVLVRAGWEPPSANDAQWVEPPNRSWVEQADRGRALFLYDPYWRDHFLISRFEPSGADYLFQGDKAAAIFGRGLRDRLYWDLNLWLELRSWLADAMERLGVNNGMLYAYYDAANPASRDAVVECLKQLVRDNVTAFPRSKGEQGAGIEHIEAAQVGYDVLFRWLNEIEESLRRAVLGQTLSGEAQATGLGSKVAELHESTFEHIIRYDAHCQAETFTSDLIRPMVRFNEWIWRGQRLRGELPFTPRFEYIIDKADVADRIQAVTAAFNMGLPLDTEKVYEDLGLSPPKDPANALVKPGAGMAPGQQPGAPQAVGPDGQPIGPPPGQPGVPGAPQGLPGQPGAPGNALGAPGMPDEVPQPAAAAPQAAPALPPPDQLEPPSEPPDAGTAPPPDLSPEQSAYQQPLGAVAPPAGGAGYRVVRTARGGFTVVPRGQAA